MLFFVEFSRLGVQLFLVIGVLFLQRLQLGLQLLGLAHADAALEIKWGQNQPDQDREYHDRPTPASDPALDPGQNTVNKIIHSGLFPP